MDRRFPQMGARPRDDFRRVVRSWLSRSRMVTPLGWTSAVVSRPDGRAGTAGAERIADASGGEGNHVDCLLVTGTLNGGGLSAMVEFLATRLHDEGVQCAVAVDGDLSVDRQDAGAVRAIRMLERGLDVRGVDEGGLKRWLSSRDFQVVSAHGAPSWMLEWASRRGIPVVETIHRTTLDGQAAEEVQNAHLVASYVAVSTLVRSSFLGACGETGRPVVEVIPNAAEAAPADPSARRVVRRELGLGEEDFLFTSLARITLQKNSFALVKVFLRFAASEPRAHLLLAGEVGDPIMLCRIRFAAWVSGARRRLHVRRYLSPSRVLLEAADAFVLDSFFEGWPLAGTEAVTSGLPLICSEVGGAFELVGEHGERGILCGHPLPAGSSLSWLSMAKVRYRRQANEALLAGAYRTIFLDRATWARQRARMREESSHRFDERMCLRRHAEVLRQHARGSDRAARGSATP